jgi:hypothetical protein
MPEEFRYPTPEEVQAIMERARHMRSQFIGVLIASAALRARQYYIVARERRHGEVRHFYSDTA